MPLSVTVQLGPPELPIQRIDPDTAGGVQPSGQSGWTLVDSEEFNGAVDVRDAVNGFVRFRPDGPLWATWYPDWQMFTDDDPVAKNHTNSNYESYYLTSKVGIASGSLSLLCDKETTVAGKDYTAGMITTIPSQRSYTYGYFEVRARISGGGTGNWPAFWTTSAAANTWNSEIDMWESFNNTSYKTNVYVDSNGGSNGDGTWIEDVETPDQTAWHVYGCKWDATSVTFYRDGVQTFTTTTHPTEAHYLLLNNGARTPENPTFTQSVVEFDYVRVWQ